jgi:SAM-dependent methyltransferase
VSTRRYGLLILPAANRVYAAAAVGLCQAELTVFADRMLSTTVRGVDEAVIGGVPYVTFETDDELGEADAAVLANLSAGYALYELRDGDTSLRPVQLHRLDQLDDDLISIPKYPGKTNEQFTKLLLNVTIAASAAAPDMLRRPLRVFDPVCGRGTTLNQALVYGYDAAGIDIDTKDFDAYTAFLRTWLKRKRLKHRATLSQQRAERRRVARRFEVTIGLDKDAYKAGDARQLTVLNADTLHAAELLPPASFDVLVADLPYGVQHGSRTGGARAARAADGSGDGGSRLQRGPGELLDAALPGWIRLLRPGAAVGLSWNTHVARRDDMVELLAEHGLRVCDSPGYDAFRHRVDQSIIRDLLVATHEG